MASTRRGVHPNPGPCTQDAQLSSVLGSQFMVRCVQAVPASSLFSPCCVTSCPMCRPLVSRGMLWLGSKLAFGSVSCCSWLYPMNWTLWIGLQISVFFIFPSLEMLLDPVSSSWLWSEPVGHGLCWGHWLMANFPLGNGFTSLVYASRLKVYTKLILKRCCYNLFGQILILFDLLHFYSPNNFPFNIIDISPFTIGTYWQITSRLTQYNIKYWGWFLWRKLSCYMKSIFP